MKKLLVFLALVITFWLATVPAHAQAPITVSSNQFSGEFPKQLVFQLNAQSSAKITEVALVVQFEGVASSSRLVPEFTPDTQVQAKYTWDLTLTPSYLPPGVTGQYWWTIRDDARNQFQTTKRAFRVDDPRHQWRKLTNDQVAIYWYDGDDRFGQAIFDRAVQSIAKLQQDTGVVVDHQIQVYIYSDRTEFLRSLGPTVKGTEGGVTFSNFINGVVLMNFSSRDLSWGEGATTHEMTHVIMHQKINSPLGNASFPLWMDEGLAMYYETYPGTLDSQFAQPLKDAIRNDKLYPIRTISGYFSSTFEAQNLAYGESFSVVDFIFRRYGRDKFTQLLQAIKTGGAYDDIFKQVLGVDADGLEAEWRKDIGAKPRAVAQACPTTPPGVVPTLSLSTDYTAPGKVEPTPTPACVPQAALQATPVAQPTAATQPSANPLTTFCGGIFGLVALGIFGAIKIGSRADASDAWCSRIRRSFF